MKNLKIFFVILFTGILIALTACRPEIDDSYPELNKYVYNFSQIFEYFWQGMNRNYLYWNSEPDNNLWRPVLGTLPSDVTGKINSNSRDFWDIMYDYYKPKFKALGEVSVEALSSSPEAQGKVQAAKDYFRDMTYGLRDGHFKIVFDDGDVIQPMIIRKEKSYEEEEPFPWASGVFYYSNLSDTNADYETYDYINEVIENYSTITINEMVENVPMGETNDPDFRFVRGTINHSGGGIILYLSYNYCSIYDLTQINKNPDVIGIYDNFLADLEKPNVKGIIMDMRGTRGDNIYDVGFFWGRMVDEPFTYSETRAKSGEGRLDYGPWIPNRVIPAPSNQKKLGNKDAKIVFLVDGGTASTAELMTMAAKAYDKGYVVGTNTMGAASKSTADGNSKAYNGGAFRMNHFIKYAGGAEVQNRSKKDNEIYDGVGITPDIKVEMSEEDWENFYGNGSDPFTDKQLEAAIKVIDPSHFP